MDLKYHLKKEGAIEFWKQPLQCRNAQVQEAAISFPEIGKTLANPGPRKELLCRLPVNGPTRSRPSAATEGPGPQVPHPRVPGTLSSLPRLFQSSG